MAEKFIDKVALIYIENRRILMALSRRKDVYYIPGGKREVAETDERTLSREIREELGVLILPQTIKHYGVFMAQAHGKPDGVMVRMACYTADFQGNPAPAGEIQSLAYYSYAQRDVVGPVDQLIFDDLKGKGIIL